MLKILRNRKGQSTAEYAILIGVVVAAVIGMQTWVSRSLKSRIFDAASQSDAIATGAGLAWPGWLNATGQYEPDVPSYSRTERQTPTREYIDPATDELVISIEGQELINRVGNQEYIP